MKLRYKASEILLIVGMTLCVLVTIHAASLVNRIVDAVSETDRYVYETAFAAYNSDIEVEIDGGFQSLFTPYDMVQLNLFKIVECIQRIPMDIVLSVPLQLNNTPDVRSVDIVFGDMRHVRKLEIGESDNFNYVSGAEAGIVYIGNAILPYVKETDEGRVLELERNPVTVAGIYDSGEKAGFDYTITLRYDTCSQAMLEALENSINNAKSNGITLTVFSDEVDVSKDWIEIADVVSEAHLTLYSNSSLMDENRAGRIYRQQAVAFMLLLYAFSFVNLTVISGFWLRHRFRELVIRCLYGQSSVEIIKMILRDFLKLLLYTIGLVIPVEILLSLTWIDASGVLEHILLTLAVFAVSLTAIVVLLTTKALAEYRRINLAENLYEQ